MHAVQPEAWSLRQKPAPRVQTAPHPVPGFALPALPARMMPTAKPTAGQFGLNSHVHTETTRQLARAEQTMVDSQYRVAAASNITSNKISPCHCSSAPIRPYSASASAKMRMRIMPTKSLGCCALALQRATPK